MHTRVKRGYSFYISLSTNTTLYTIDAKIQLLVHYCVSQPLSREQTLRGMLVDMLPQVVVIHKLRNGKQSSEILNMYILGSTLLIYSVCF